MRRDQIPELQRKEGLRHVSEYLREALPELVDTPRRPTFRSLTSHRIKAGLHFIAVTFRGLA